MFGTLYIVATPIGNLGDITLRALETLKSVDFILCEDTRHTQKILNHFEIKTPTISYHQHSDERKLREIKEILASGKSLALVTDAGTPGISDPGNKLVSVITDHQSPVVPIPGPSALTQVKFYSSASRLTKAVRNFSKKSRRQNTPSCFTNPITELKNVWVNWRKF